MALSLLSTAQQNQQNQTGTEDSEEKQDHLVPQTESCAPDTAGTTSHQIAPLLDDSATNNNEKSNVKEEAVIPQQRENAVAALAQPTTEASNVEPATSNATVKEEAVIPNVDTLPQQPRQLSSRHKRKLPNRSSRSEESDKVTNDNSEGNQEASSSRPSSSVRAKRTRFPSKFIPNENQSDYEKRKEYFSAITGSFKEVGTHILGSNGQEFLILTIEEDESQEDGEKTKTSVSINMVKANVFNEVFRLIRDELNYRTYARLKKSDINTWVEDVSKLEKEQRDAQYIFPPTFFHRFHDVLRKMLDYEQNKKNPKDKRADAGRVHELVLKKLDEIATSLGYCCGQKRCVVYQGFDEPYPESEIRCKLCWKEFHVQCVLWNSLVDGSPSDFVCRRCSSGTARTVNMEQLQKTPSSIFIEDGINQFLGTLENLSEVPGKMSCRLFVCLRSEEMDDHEKQRFSGIYNLMEKVPRTFKIYGITQEHDGQAVLVYLMAVNEYCKGDGVPKHKQGLLSFEFIDTVKYLQPPKKSREINQKILRLYLQNAQQRGFTKARIHASAPGSKECDFMFNNRPLFKKNLAQQGLFDWYKDNVEKLIVDLKEEGIRMTYEHVFDPSKHLTVKTICEELYMAEGFWPVFLEKYHKKPIKKFKEMVEEESRSRDNCQFYIRFEDQRKVKIAADEDPFIASKIAASRFVWMNTQREKEWLFDSLRHAKFATMMLLTTLEMERKPEVPENQLSNESGGEIYENESKPSTSRT